MCQLALSNEKQEQNTQNYPNLGPSVSQPVTACIRTYTLGLSLASIHTLLGTQVQYTCHVSGPLLFQSSSPWNPWTLTHTQKTGSTRMAGHPNMVVRTQETTEISLSGTISYNTRNPQDFEMTSPCWSLLLRQCCQPERGLALDTSKFNHVALQLCLVRHQLCLGNISWSRGKGGPR